MGRRIVLIGDRGPFYYNDEEVYPSRVLDVYGITTQDGFVTEGNIALLEDGDENGFFRHRFETFNIAVDNATVLPDAVIGESSAELLIEEGKEEIMAKAYLHTGREDTAVPTQPWGGFSTVSGTSDSINIFHDGSAFKMENGYSTSAAVFVHAKKFELGF